MKFMKHVYLLIQINDIQTLMIEKSIQEILAFFKIFRDKSWTKIEPGSWKLNPRRQCLGRLYA